MDQFDRIIFDIRRKTSDEELDWKIVPPASVSRIVLNPDRVVRAYSADYPVQERIYPLVFVERRVELFDGYSSPYESLDFEVFVLDSDDGEVVLTLYDGVVDRDDLVKLSGLIKTHNDRAKAFLSAFDDTDAA
jgi:hypothetical protein